MEKAYIETNNFKAIKKKEENSLANLTWIDYTRRNDPACKKGVEILKKQLKKYDYPEVFCFWTKAPERIAQLYSDIIKEMQANNTLVLLQTTINNYSELEKVNPKFKSLDNIIKLLGGPEFVRLRFDPIILGYTTPKHFLDTLELAKNHNIDRIITNFLIPEYKNVGKLLKNKGLNIRKANKKKQIEILNKFIDYANDQVDIAVCAESANLVNDIPQLKMAKCSDPDWAIKLKPELEGIFTKNPSRKNCGCVYANDWGGYSNWKGFYNCPFNCLYCYAAKK